MEAVIFVGLQGAGKSHFFNEHFRETHLRINLDSLKTRHRESLVLLATIQQKLNFVVDNTNPVKEQRAKYISAAKRAGYRVVCFYFVPDIKRSLDQNSKRTGMAKVHPAAIYGTRKKLQPPQFAEGFDAIFEVTLTAGDEFLVTEQPRGGPKF